MTSIALNTAYTQDGIETVSFWNGRVLTAEDLHDEQRANDDQRRLLGRAIGDGVVTGFEVTAGTEATTVDVQPGLAIDRLGDPIVLNESITVSLVGSGSESTDDATVFGPCNTLPSLSGAGTGLYVLLACSASASKDTAPKVPLSGNGSASECGPRYDVDGVAFKLVELKSTTLVEDSDIPSTDITTLSAADDLASHSRLRSLVATLLNGAAALKDFYREPDDDTTTYGPLDLVRQAVSPAITDRDVPIALVFWTDSAVRWVDMWSVRRTPSVPVTGSAWLVPVAARRLAEGEAGYRQFTEHVGWLKKELTKPGPPNLIEDAVATDWFRFLPPAGVIPLIGLHTDDPPGGPGSVRAFRFASFFEGLAVRPLLPEVAEAGALIVSRARAETLLRTSFTYTPTDLTSGEMQWVYSVDENRRDSIDSAAPAPPYAVFTTGQMPYMADGQFDLTRWDLGNFGFGNLPTTNGD